MNEAYYILENGNLKKVGSVIKTSKGWVTNPTAEDCAAMVDANGKPNPAYPRSDASMEMPKLEDGYRAVADGWKLVDGEWYRVWTAEPITYTYNDYDNAMEDYIRQIAVDRGYTRREPSSYDDDPYPRFAQDAKDFKAFRSAVMLYALPILNKYKNNEEVPTLAEFKAGFPKMVWTFE